MAFIRVWQESDGEELSKHLLIVGDLLGDCSNCRALGIDWTKAKICPQCSTDFKYIASRSKEVRKIKERRPDLIFIDFDDYKSAVGRIKARKLFAGRI